MVVAETIGLTGLEITRFFLAILLLFTSARVFGYVFSIFRLPRVVGEITGGLVLGPTVLAFFFPGVFNSIFSAFEAEGKLLSGISWLGLVLLMFVSGFEMQRSISPSDKKTVFAILLGGTIVPFIIGWVLPYFYDFTPFLGPQKNLLAFQLILGIAIAVTSIPVISKIFIDLGVINTRFAKIILATATLEDIVLFAALALATGLIGTAVTAENIVSTIMITIGFFAMGFIVVPKLMSFVSHTSVGSLIESNPSAYALFICFVFVALAGLLNVNIIFGAFLAGIVINLMPQKIFESIKASVKDVSLAFFIPLYFAVVGLRLNLITYFDLVFFAGFLLVAVVVKMLGTLVAARLARKDWLTSFNLAAAMNARGGPAIVLATVAFDAGIINEVFFASLVLLAIVTSIMSGSWFNYVLARGWRLMK